MNIAQTVWVGIASSDHTIGSLQFAAALMLPGLIFCFENDNLSSAVARPYAEISLVARSRSSLTTSLTSRTTSYSEIALEVMLQVSLLVRLASLTS